MSQRGKVAAGPNRSFLGNDGMDTAIEHFDEQLDDLHPDPAESEREHIGAQQHHGPHFGFRERLATPQQWLRTKFACNSSSSSAATRTSESLPKPVFTP